MGPQGRGGGGISLGQGQGHLASHEYCGKEASKVQVQIHLGSGGWEQREPTLVVPILNVAKEKY